MKLVLRKKMSFDSSRAESFNEMKSTQPLRELEQQIRSELGSAVNLIILKSITRKHDGSIEVDWETQNFSEEADHVAEIQSSLRWSSKFEVLRVDRPKKKVIIPGLEKVEEDSEGETFKIHPVVARYMGHEDIIDRFLEKNEHIRDIKIVAEEKTAGSGDLVHRGAYHITTSQREDGSINSPLDLFLEVLNGNRDERDILDSLNSELFRGMLITVTNGEMVRLKTLSERPVNRRSTDPLLEQIQQISDLYDGWDHSGVNTYRFEGMGEGMLLEYRDKFTEVPGCRAVITDPFSSSTGRAGLEIKVTNEAQFLSHTENSMRAGMR